MKVFNVISKFTYVLIFLLLTSKSSRSQNSTSFTPLFEEQTQNLVKQVFVENNKLICKINNSITHQFNLEGKPFAFVQGVDGKSFAILRYFFGQKSEKSNFELYLLDENFAVSFYRKFDFYYEEPLPKVLVLSSGEFLLFNPSQGKLKLFNKTREVEFDLFNGEKQEFSQERIGQFLPYYGKILITLSQLKKDDLYHSKIFLLNNETLEIKSADLNLPIIYKVFLHSSTIYLSGIETEPIFKTGFYLLNLDENDLTSISLEKISDEFIEGQVKNSENLFFGRNCLYSIENKNLEKASFCLQDEIILDALLTNNSFFVITRKDLISNLYKLDRNFNIVEKVTINRYLTSPELKLSLNKYLYIIDKNQTILVKNFSEE
ncbi:MAG: hypothetical protein WHV63_03315 [Ignavibacteria bacterium]|nr:hypothetical protein [Ignavibacteria bacterium]